MNSGSMNNKEYGVKDALVDLFSIISLVLHDKEWWWYDEETGRVETRGIKGEMSLEEAVDEMIDGLYHDYDLLEKYLDKYPLYKYPL